MNGEFYGSYLLCEQIRSLDINKRGHRVLEQVPPDTLKKVIDIIYAEIQ